MTIKRFFIHLLLMFAVVALILFLTFMWLKIYTNHGQKLELPSYLGLKFEKAHKDADKETFELIINDSIHVVGKEGGLILNQNPKAGSLVKENRKIYVDVTKYTADEYSLEKDIKTLYGQDFDRVKERLKGLELKAVVKGEKADSGAENHVLEVYYDGQLVDGKNGRKPGVKISKGATLEFIVSKAYGQSISVPDWTCKQLGVVRTLARFNKIKIGEIESMGGAITNRDSAFVIKQFPAPDPLSTMVTGGSIDILIQQAKPSNCQ